MLQYGGRGDKNGQLNNPIGITTHQDQVYVADRHNGCISVFQNNGKFHDIIGQQQLSHSFDIAVNINSEILVADGDITAYTSSHWMVIMLVTLHHMYILVG